MKSCEYVALQEKKCSYFRTFFDIKKEILNNKSSFKHLFWMAEKIRSIYSLFKWFILHYAKMLILVVKEVEYDSINY